MRLGIHHRPCLPTGPVSYTHLDVYKRQMLEDDGRLDEKIFNEYMNLSLRYPPRFTQVSTEEAAWKQLELSLIHI